MSKILFGIFLLISSVAVNAQNNNNPDKKVTISIGPEIGFVVGVNSAFYSMVVGGTAEAEMSINDRFAAALMAGANFYMGKKIYDFKFETLRVVPLKAGLKYYLKPTFYAGAQAGAGFFNNGANTKFGYSFLLGYKAGLGGGKALDLSLKTDAYTGNGGSIASIAARAALQF